jgi:hypothetical protein
LFAASASEPARPPGRSPATCCTPMGWGLAASPREGWQPDRGETPGFCQRLDAQRNSPAPRSGDTPGPRSTSPAMIAFMTAPTKRSSCLRSRYQCRIPADQRPLAGF